LLHSDVLKDIISWHLPIYFSRYLDQDTTKGPLRSSSQAAVKRKTALSNNCMIYSTLSVLARPLGLRGFPPHPISRKGSAAPPPSDVILTFRSLEGKF